MKVEDVFKEIFVGINLSTCCKTTEKQDVYTFKKENIIYSSITYNNFGYNKFKNRERYDYIIKNDLQKIQVPKNIKEKYYIKYNDIIISLKKPYKVFNDIITTSDKIVITNNYIILREIDTEKYYAPYLKYYIENIGINELLKKNIRINNELSLEDVKNIELPTISLNEQINKYFEITALVQQILKSENQIIEILKDDL